MQLRIWEAWKVFPWEGTSTLGPNLRVKVGDDMVQRLL